MSDNPATIYAIAILFSILAVAATALRFYARSIKKTGLSWDDWAIVPALVCLALIKRSRYSRPFLIVLGLHDCNGYYYDHR